MASFDVTIWKGPDRLEVHVDDSTTLDEVKAMIEDEEGIPPDLQLILRDGQPIYARTIGEAYITKGSVLTLGIKGEWVGNEIRVVPFPPSQQRRAGFDEFVMPINDETTIMNVKDAIRDKYNIETEDSCPPPDVYAHMYEYVLVYAHTHTPTNPQLHPQDQLLLHQGRELDFFVGQKNVVLSELGLANDPTATLQLRVVPGRLRLAADKCARQPVMLSDPLRVGRLAADTSWEWFPRLAAELQALQGVHVGPAGCTRRHCGAHMWAAGPAGEPCRAHRHDSLCHDSLYHAGQIGMIAYALQALREEPLPGVRVQGVEMLGPEAMHGRLLQGANGVAIALLVEGPANGPYAGTSDVVPCGRMCVALG